ncbi:hypothetical protein BDZ91DRAFT_730776 [Kalaharituber pfeilii]|nr:hypothetical protein BDZ91DRAFT_730776 [Kalaharituber pfeilii]
MHQSMLHNSINAIILPNVGHHISPILHTFLSLLQFPPYTFRKYQSQFCIQSYIAFRVNMIMVFLLPFVDSLHSFSCFPCSFIFLQSYSFILLNDLLSFFRIDLL